jgi:hypothetical protein
MAKVIDTYTNEAGHEIDVYESGAEYNRTLKRLAKPAAHTVITAQNATALNRKRQEKAAAELRRRITEAARQGMPPGTLIRHSADAFAAAGVQLFEEVVMNSDAYPRDRKEVFEMLGKYAQVLPADMRQAATDDGTAAAALHAATAAANAQTARILARVFADVKRVQAQQAQPPAAVVDAEAVDA